MIGARNLKKNGNSFVGGWSGWLSHFFLCLLSLLNSYSQMFSSRQAEKWLFSRSSRCFCTCDQKLKKVDAKINLAKTQKCLFLKSFHSCFTNSLEFMSFIAPLLSPSGDLGIGLVWDNHPTRPDPTHFLVRVLKSSSNWTKLSMKKGPQLFSGWYQIILNVFRCSQLFPMFSARL